MHRFFFPFRLAHHRNIHVRSYVSSLAMHSYNSKNADWVHLIDDGVVVRSISKFLARRSIYGDAMTSILLILSFFSFSYDRSYHSFFIPI